MDIVLNPFNNPNLPLIPTPGFVDYFNRPQANTLGVADSGQPWHIINPGTTSSTWGTTGNGTAGMLNSTTQHHLAVLDGETINGTLTAQLDSLDTDAPNRRVGLALSVASDDHYIGIAPTSASDHRIRVSQNSGSGAIPMDGYGPELQPGDELSATLNGLNVTVQVNGETVLDVQVHEEPTSSRHGLYAFYQAQGTWEHITFNPA